MTKAEQILNLVQSIAHEYDLFQSRGPGAGNKHINEALAELNRRVAKTLGWDCIQQSLTANNKQSVDFWLEDEKTIIEVEFSLTNPYPCLEKDLFKTFLALDAGKSVERLVLIGDPGCRQRLLAPAPRSVINWAKKHHGIDVLVWELSP
jgi:hypothetical protein